MEEIVKELPNIEVYTINAVQKRQWELTILSIVRTQDCMGTLNASGPVQSINPINLLHIHRYSPLKKATDARYQEIVFFQ